MTTNNDWLILVKALPEERLYKNEFGFWAAEETGNLEAFTIPMRVDDGEFPYEFAKSHGFEVLRYPAMMGIRDARMEAGKQHLAWLERFAS